MPYLHPIAAWNRRDSKQDSRLIQEHIASVNWKRKIPSKKNDRKSLNICKCVSIYLYSICVFYAENELPFVLLCEEVIIQCCPKPTEMKWSCWRRSKSNSNLRLFGWWQDRKLANYLHFFLKIIENWNIKQ